MRDIINVQKQLVPELVDVLRRRHKILRHIKLMGSTGRRTLSASLGMTERTLRTESDFLKSQGLLEIDSNGMRISPAGEALLQAMEPVVREVFALRELEDQLQARYQLSAVTVVQGDSDVSPLTKKELGRAGAAALMRVAQPGDIIAVTGGTTIAAVASALNASALLKGASFVPARGGLGGSVDLQANTIASNMAKKTGALYRLLHVPDHLGEEAYQSLMQEPDVQEVVGVIRNARIVVHGIGDAVRMARRRKLGDERVEALVREGALAESFGYYFNRDGQVVHQMPTVGLRLEEIQRVEQVIAVAGGASKGEAISAILRFGHEDMLITDEAAARIILE